MTSPPEDRLLITIPEETAQEVFEEKFSDLKKSLEKQQALSWQIILAVGIAFLFTVGLMALDYIQFHTRADKNVLDLQNQYFQEVKELREKNYQSELRLQRELDELKPKLPPSVPPKQ